MIKVSVRPTESIQDAVRRFGTLCKRSGLRTELRRRRFYEKPSDERRRKEQRNARRVRRNSP